jgi:hypothetical protein
MILILDCIVPDELLEKESALKSDSDDTKSFREMSSLSKLIGIILYDARYCI